MNRRSLSSLFLLLILIGMVTLPIGCSSGSSSSSSPENGPTPTPIPTSIVPTNPTYQVQRGDVVRLLQFSGRAAPVREEELFFRANGYVETVYARRNDSVKEGDLLAELEVTDLKNQISQVEAELLAVKMNNDRQVAEFMMLFRRNATRIKQFLKQLGPFLTKDIGSGEGSITADNDEAIYTFADQIECGFPASIAVSETLASS